MCLTSVLFFFHHEIALHICVPTVTQTEQLICDLYIIYAIATCIQCWIVTMQVVLKIEVVAVVVSECQSHTFHDNPLILAALATNAIKLFNVN